MSFFSATILTALAGRTVRKQMLAELQFTSGTERVCEGAGTLIAGGHTWKGLGQFGSVDGISQRMDGGAAPLTMRLSGIDSDIVAAAADAENEVKGNLCKLYLQFFDDQWATLDSPACLGIWIMDTMVFDIGAEKSTVILTAESIFAARRSARYARYTDRDQQARYSGDKGCEYVPALVNATFTWPDYSS